MYNIMSYVCDIEQMYSDNFKNLKSMETNWILIALVLVCSIGLILFLILRNKKDKENVIDSQNALDDLEHEEEREKDLE